MRLQQKRFLKGSREFEIADDAVMVRIKTARKEESLTVMLAILNPEPVQNGNYLEFHSRVKCGPLLSLFVDNPDAATFNAFVDELKRRARQEYSAFTGLKANPEAAAEGLAANSYDEPPEFDDPAPGQRKTRPIRAESIASSIQMLEQHLGSDGIESLLEALKALMDDPDNETRQGELVKAFEDLGPRQGAVLTYAPYLSILLSDDPFAF